MPKNQGRPKKNPQARWLAQMNPAVARLKRIADKNGITWPDDLSISQLTLLTIEPDLMTHFSEWFAAYYEKRPGFVLWFMHNIRVAAFKMPIAEHWLSSPLHKHERDTLKDDEIALRLRDIAGHGINTRSIESARRKLRLSQRKAE